MKTVSVCCAAVFLLSSALSVCSAYPTRELPSISPETFRQVGDLLGQIFPSESEKQDDDALEQLISLPSWRWRLHRYRYPETSEKKIAQKESISNSAEEQRWRNFEFWRNFGSGLSRLLATCPLQFRCTNGQCVGRGRRCDGTRHCRDGSDEENCSTKESASKSQSDLMKDLLKELAAQEDE